MTKVGTLQNAESEFLLQRSMWPVPTTKRLLDLGADDARDDHETKQRKDDTVPMTQEPSSGPGVERSPTSSQTSLSDTRGDGYDAGRS